MADDAAKLTSGSLSNDPDLNTLLLQHKIQQFYYKEAALLDDRRYAEWLTLFTPDTYYFMPVRRTRTSNELDKEFTQQGEVALFDDDYNMLASRIKKLDTGYAWAEDPPSRQRHLVTNVRVLSDDGAELLVESNFHFYRTRLNSEEDNWLGLRRDRLRRVDGEFKVARRDIFLEQTVLLARNLSNFF